ncbi:membrane protein DedA with SNARE-associated domain [Bacillus ectoiniformans]|uniref:DedA family protein n=1 Tax=Bacillus ectoiniformans TaxID=1494429 RepID=UPI0019597AC7|nr:VTT domain-containing protein [Bacillus ectoiniformans]MBM7647356.1 membrane protein DedA with SNARE-associated domain [Bacillus ectoiniformans]
MDLGSVSLTEVYESFGYAGLLIYGWLGLLGLPLPNEMIVMTNGYMAEKGLFQPVLAFILTYASVISVIYLSFLTGRILSAFYSHILERRMFQKSRQRIEKHGAKALSISVIVPGLRLLLPCAAGFSGFSHKDLLKYSFIPNFIWALVYFLLGYYFFSEIHIKSIQIGVISIAALLILAMIIPKMSKDKKLQEN